MRNRNDLTITAVAEILTSSTDFALQVVSEREQQNRDEKSGKGMTIPWVPLLASGAAIAALFAYMRETEEEVASDSGAPQVPESAEDQAPTPVLEDDNEESLLDKVVAWVKQFPTDSLGTPTVPKSPVVANDKGASMVNSPARSFEAPEEAGDTVASYILNAAKVTGMDPGTLFTVAKIESNFKVDAKNRITGATGLFQFTPSTWKWLIKKYPELGYTDKDIHNPGRNAIMGAVYLRHMQTTLSKALGRAPTPLELYLGHFLGPTGAIRFIRKYEADPNSVASKAFPAAAKANKNIFFDGTRSRTVAEVMGVMSGKVNPVYAQYTKTSVASTSTETAPPLPETKPQRAAMSYSTPSVDTKPAPVTVGSLSAVANQKVARTTAANLDTSLRNDEGTPQAITSPKKTLQGDLTYYRNSSGTLVAIPT